MLTKEDVDLDKLMLDIAWKSLMDKARQLLVLSQSSR